MSDNIYEHGFSLSRADKSKITRTKGCVVWMTGLSGSGKSTIADELEKKLHRSQYHAVILDGDKVRSGICLDLGFSQIDRKENIRRTAEIAKLIKDNAMIVICSLISPLREQREMAKMIIGEDDFVECYINTSYQICKDRDPKGIYKKQIENFSGRDSVYEPPQSPHIIIKTEELSPNESAKIIFDHLMSDNYLF